MRKANYLNQTQKNYFLKVKNEEMRQKWMEDQTKKLEMQE